MSDKTTLRGMMQPRDSADTGATTRQPLQGTFEDSEVRQRGRATRERESEQPEVSSETPPPEEARGQNEEPTVSTVRVMPDGGDDQEEIILALRELSHSNFPNVQRKGYHLPRPFVAALEETRSHLQDEGFSARDTSHSNLISIAIARLYEDLFPDKKVQF